MKSINKIFILIISIIALIFILSNIYFSTLSVSDNERLYRVEINRVENDIKSNGYEGLDLSYYECIEQVLLLPQNSDDSAEREFFQGCDSDYVIRIIDGLYYRIDYSQLPDSNYSSVQLAANIAMVVMAVCVIAVLIYIKVRIIKPFDRIKSLPYELSKGNLTVDIKENKSRYFGKFIWGLNLLRENMEEQKSKELALQKDKKTLVLSISHDIKTPLSAIKLYSKALIRNLYDSEEKRNQIALKIDEKADEIEKYVSEIIKASNEDFLNLEVKSGEFYLKELISEIDTYYSEKLTLLKIDFHIEKYSNCIVKGDLDRAVEVFQNVMENAIKYGDGNSVKITFDREEDCRLVTVINTGCKLKGDELPHIFDSFWRGSNTGSNAGSGLGLYICRQLMNKMDGEIFARIIDNNMAVTLVFRDA